MFGTLQIHDLDARLVLDQATQITNKLHAQNNPALDTTLCEEAAAFMKRIAETTKGVSREATNQNGANRENPVAAFLHGFLALLSHDLSATPTESARKARIELGLALARSEMINQSSRSDLRALFDSWLKSERSKMLRDEVNAAVESNNRYL